MSPGRVGFSKQAYYRKVGYTPHEGQRDLHSDTHRFRVVSNGRRWGKTIFGAREMEPRIHVPCHFTREGQLGWIVGPQYADAEKEFRVIYDSLRKQGLDRDAIKFVNNVDSGSMNIILPNGAQILAKSAAHPETLVGEGLNWVLMVEAGRHKRRTWGQYIRPTLSDKRGIAIFTGVPEGKSENSLLYHLYQRGQSSRFASWQSWKRPSWTNNIVFPGGRQDPEILEAEADLTTDEFDRQYGAEFTDKTGLVMKEFEEDIHVGDFDYEPSWALYMAIDYGFTNPFVVLWIQVGPHGDEIRVIREQRWQRLDTVEVAEDIQATVPGLVRACVRMYPDPAEPDDTRTLERMLRIPANKNTGGEIKTRLALIRRALKERNTHLPAGHADRIPTLRIDRSCQTLIWEMREGYKWPEHRSEIKSDSENPMDKDNHGVEALGRFFRGMYRKPEGRGSVVSTAQMG